MENITRKVILQELLAERVLSEQLPCIHPLYPRLSQNIATLGRLKFALDMKRRYQSNQFN